MRGLFNYFTVVMIIRGLNKTKKLSGHKKIETLQELGKYIFSRHDLEFEFDSLFRFVRFYRGSVSWSFFLVVLVPLGNS